MNNPIISCQYCREEREDQPEQEYEDYLIEVCDGEDGDESDLKSFLGVKKKFDNSPILPHEHTYLYCLPSLPNFERFMYHESFGKLPSVGLAQVATKIYQGHQVYARFRKGEK